MMIVKATIFLVLFVFLVNLLFHRPLLEILPVRPGAGGWTHAGTAADDRFRHPGAWRDAPVARQVIVKRLSAIDDLGSMDVFCSDKTGTLTEAHIELVREVDFAGQKATRSCNGAAQRRFRDRAQEPAGRRDPRSAGRSDLAAGARSTKCRSISNGARVSVLVEGGRPASHHREGRAGGHAWPRGPL